jgi:hypothetical protein
MQYTDLLTGWTVRIRLPEEAGTSVVATVCITDVCPTSVLWNECRYFRVGKAVERRSFFIQTL